MPQRSITQRAARRLLTLRRRRPGTERIEIRRLISPLRYDVVVRAKFLASLRSRDADEDAASLHEFAVRDPYFTWFKYVESARFFPELLDDPELLLQRFYNRVGRALVTLRSYDAGGFDLRYPVTLARCDGGVRTDSGIRVSNSVHIRDGCHRLALLLISGRSLEPDMYRVHNATGPLPDNTALLLQHLTIEDRDYARFLSATFSTKECDQLPELRRQLSVESPDRLDELDAVLRVHHLARNHAG